jgi:S1-C subfamily serine protease
MEQTVKSPPWVIALAMMVGVLGGLGIWKLLNPSSQFQTIPSNKISSQLSASAIYQRAKPAVWTVRTDLARLDDLEARGVGTAFHLGEGYFVTSAHVIAGSRLVMLEDSNRTLEKANSTALKVQVVGSDTLTDIAVLKIETSASKLEWASELPRIGDSVYAIGNPFGRAPGSFSSGIVSGLERVFTAEDLTLVHLLQTDTAINPGNSGGPLLNSQGQVVGINAAIIGGAGSSAGVGFVVPFTVAKRICHDLIKQGKVQHVSLGVTGKNDQPAKIESVLPGSSAERAGIKTGDLILTVDGVPLETFAELAAMIAHAAPSSKLKLEILRAGNRQTLELQL